MHVRALTESDRPWATDLVRQHFGSPVVVSRGICHDARSLPGLVLEEKAERLGLVQYHIAAGRCEVVVLIAVRERQGFGRRMLIELASLARDSGCRCLWLVTTNDNRAAQQFYQAIGWRQVAIHRGAVAEARRLKPEIPECADDGTPIVDEIEYEFALDGD